jgi:hypothetical protein
VLRLFKNSQFKEMKNDESKVNPCLEGVWGDRSIAPRILTFALGGGDIKRQAPTAAHSAPIE